MGFSQFSNGQVTVNIPQYGLIVGGGVRFSPGDGFVFGKQGGTFTNTFRLLQSTSIPNNLIPQALQYGWEQKSTNSNYILNADVTLTDAQGKEIFSNSYKYYGEYDITKKEYNYSLTNININQLNGLKVTFTSNKANVNQNWSGPEIRNIFANIVYEENKCNVDPSSNPSCSGYNRAQVSKLCEINPQISISCPNYKPVIASTNTTTNEGLQVNMNSITSTTSYTLVPYIKPTDIVKPIQKTDNNTSNKNTQNLNRNLKEKDPQTEKLQEMQSSGPDINTYANMSLKDVPFYRQREIYRNVIIPDNARAQRQLTQRSNISHGRMVDEQYRK